MLSAVGCPAAIRTSMKATASTQSGKGYVLGSVRIAHTNAQGIAYGVSDVSVTLSNSQGQYPIVTTAYCSGDAVAAGSTVHCDFIAELPGAIISASAWDSVRATATVNGGTCEVAAAKVQQTQSVMG
jgi:hypothetical protein